MAASPDTTAGTGEPGSHACFDADDPRRRPVAAPVGQACVRPAPNGPATVVLVSDPTDVVRRRAALVGYAYRCGVGVWPRCRSEAWRPGAAAPSRLQRRLWESRRYRGPRPPWRIRR